MVISDSPIQLLPLVLVRPELLASNGYAPILRTEHYTVWKLGAFPPAAENPGREGEAR